MPSRGLCLAIVAIVLTLLPGCGTLVDHRFGPCPQPRTARIYGGVRQDLDALSSGSATAAAFSVVDMPFSAIADTILLPGAINASMRRSSAAPQVNDENSEG